MTFYRRLRLRYGLFWTSKYPKPSKDFWVLLGVIIAYLFASYVDDLERRISEHEKRMVIYASYRQVVLDAMNGSAVFMVGNEGFECKGGALGKVEL